MADLQKFAKGLKPSCSPAKLELCDDAQVAKIQEIEVRHDRGAWSGKGEGHLQSTQIGKAVMNVFGGPFILQCFIVFHGILKVQSAK